MGTLNRRGGRNSVFRTAGLLSAFGVLFAGTVASADDSDPASVESVPVVCSVVMVEMRDGVELATEVYRPERPGKYPVVIERGPYNGYAGGAVPADCAPRAFSPDMAGLASRGYVVLRQDVRGTHRSGGQFQPIVQEGRDGFDAVEWAARQPWSSGKVGMIGGSYAGMTQWQTALQKPPHLVTIVPWIAPTSTQDAWPYQSGIFGQFVVQSWTNGRVQEGMYRQLKAQGKPQAEIVRIIDAYARETTAALFAPVSQGLPLKDNPAFNTEFSPWYAEWLRQRGESDYWKPYQVEGNYGKLSIPVLSLGGFYDLFALGTVNGFRGMRERSATEVSRNGSRLILAGGGHAAGPNGYVGAITFGPENDIRFEETVRWFDHWLKGVENGVSDEPPARLYVMVPPDQGSIGSGFWISGESFPLPGTGITRYFLGGGAANSLGGGGTLTTVPAAGKEFDRFVFDPLNPVPTIGGTICCDPMLLPGGAFDQRPVEIRSDVLVYTSAVLEEPVPVIGNVSVTLKAASSEPGSAFAAKLVDVHPDGFSQNIADGIVAAASKNGDEPAEYTIRMNPTATIFKKGHRIRLEISSSNYPRFPVSTDPDIEASDMKPAMQTVFRDGASLNLPVAPSWVLKELSE